MSGAGQEGSFVVDVSSWSDVAIGNFGALEQPLVEVAPVGLSRLTLVAVLNDPLMLNLIGAATKS